ncbi:MAG: M23 family metallopeptidase [Lachnospiraceae bacterium]|nr:M23 family metallopeptidase [Lachnospiraceae bacterium]
MKKRKVTRFNKEKIMMLSSSLLIVAACALTGVYVNRMENKDVESQVVDFSKLEDDTETAETKTSQDLTASIVDDLDADPYFAETGGNSVINPDSKKTVSENSIDMSSNSEEKKEDNTQDNNESDSQEKHTGETEEAEETASGSILNGAFKESDGMGWPVLGNVVLNYSMDQTVFFSTLSQYKYNPAIIISANEGENVSACAKGVVKKVGNSEEIGNYIEMDLGNGYELILGQLNEITVLEGSTVERGQVVGCVAAPTKYYSMEGTNIYMKVLKNGTPMNPMSLLD